MRLATVTLFKTACLTVMTVGSVAFAGQSLASAQEDETGKVRPTNLLEIELGDEDLGYLDVSAVKYLFKDTVVRLNGRKLEGATLSTRGQGCLDAPRRCFYLKMRDRATVYRADGNDFLSQKLVLGSMREDVGYVTGMIGHESYKKVGLFPLKYAYTEVRINGATNGLYFIMEKPEHILEKIMKSPAAMRRQYLKGPKVEVYEEDLAHQVVDAGSEVARAMTQAEYVAAFKDATNATADLQGRELYRYLDRYVDLEQYLDLLAANAVVRNGDDYDETFFYAQRPLAGEPVRFSIMAWDLESLFRKPHFSWNNSLAPRAFFKKTLVYSQAAALDRVVADDAYLYGQFLARLQRQLTDGAFTPAAIADSIAKVRTEVIPYLGNAEMLAQSVRDATKSKDVPYSADTVLAWLATRHQQLLARRSELLARIEKIR